MLGKLFGLSLLAVLLAYVYQSKWGQKSDGPLGEGKTEEKKYGKIKGLTLVSRDGRPFYGWLNIPYAKSPEGKLRFKTPQPIEPWGEGIREATEYGHECPQLSIWGAVEGSEDCLSLNTFVPKDALDQKKRLPVLFWIHGGYFSTGSGQKYQPDYFMDENIVLVTINYRLGALGFLNMGDKDGRIRGNMGLKDQSLALKWVKSEIGNFGGDPNHIVIMGESAGSASVYYQMLSPMSKGLFKKGIAQSGTALNPWALNDHPKEQALELAQKLNCPTTDLDKMAECLQNADVASLLGKYRPGLANLFVGFAKKNDILRPIPGGQDGW